MNDVFFTEAEVAAKLRVSKGTMSRLRRNGTGPAHRRVNARTVLYSEAAVVAWINNPPAATAVL